MVRSLLLHLLVNFIEFLSHRNIVTVVVILVRNCSQNKENEAEEKSFKVLVCKSLLFFNVCFMYHFFKLI